jgi:hypothetical protein
MPRTTNILKISTKKIKKMQNIEKNLQDFLKSINSTKLANFLEKFAKCSISITKLKKKREKT